MSLAVIMTLTAASLNPNQLGLEGIFISRLKTNQSLKLINNKNLFIRLQCIQHKWTKLIQLLEVVILRTLLNNQWFHILIRKILQWMNWLI
jgi:hypothetical protein